MDTSKFFMEKHHGTDRMIPILDDGTQVSAFNLIILMSGTILAELLSIWAGVIGDSNSSMLFMAVTSVLQAVGPIVIVYFFYRKFGHQEFKSLFHKITLRDLSFGLMMTILGGIYALVMALFVLKGSTVPNSSAQGITHGVDGLIMVGVSAFNDIFLLFTEELTAIIPFIASAALANKYFKFNRNHSIWFGLLISILVFGTMHFYTDSWHIAQMYLIVGMSRIFDTGMYIRTKNILISFIFHWIFDTAIILMYVLR